MESNKEQHAILFEQHAIRRVYDKETDTWWFSVVDIIQILTGSPNARDYWFRMKVRVKQEDGSELSTICRQLKMEAPDGKMRLTDAANAEGLLRIIQSVPSPKAEPIKLWLAKVGYERMQELGNPELAVARARETWEKHGRTQTWIKHRLMGLETRIRLTDYWASHEIRPGSEFAMLTNVIHEEWSELSVKAHKELKGLEQQNLRDHMTEGELIFTALAELSTRQIAEKVDAKGFQENHQAAKSGGGIAKNARLALEEQTGQPVVSQENSLPKLVQATLEGLGSEDG
jgi:DNA-damage-inducible protein D